MTTKAETTGATKASTKTAKPAAAPKGLDAFSDLFAAPSFDFDAVVEFQRKNVEAGMEVGRILMDGAKTATQKNIDAGKTAAAEFTDVVTGVVSAKTPETSFSALSEMGQQVFQKNVALARDVADIFVDANQKAVTVLQERYSDGMKEMQAATK